MVKRAKEDRALFCKNVTTLPQSVCSLMVESVVCLQPERHLCGRRPLLLRCAAIWAVGVCREHVADSYATPLLASPKWALWLEL